MGRSPASLRAKADSQAKRFRTYYLSIKGRTAHMLNNGRARAKREGVAFSLTEEWVRSRLEAGRCEVTGLPFVMLVGHGKGHRKNAYSPSLERRDPTGPYSPDNTVMACWIYNRAKGAFSHDELMVMVRALAAKERADA